VGREIAFGAIIVLIFAAVGAVIAYILHWGVYFGETRIIEPYIEVPGKIEEGMGEVIFSPPAVDDAPAHLKDAVKQGFNILMKTRKQVPEHVGNKLDCSSCHFQAGSIEDTLSLVGVAAIYPTYSKRQDQVIDLVSRTNSCFERNLNGQPLDPDGKDIRDILAYYQWISKGLPVYADIPWLGLKELQSEHTPGASQGKKDYENKCVPCHEIDGGGTLIGPPLWGDNSFSDGSELANLEPFAAFTHRFMPKGNPDLTVDQALDIAAYVTKQNRPHFSEKSQ
jgi:thiosulfate dehydrogenase